MQEPINLADHIKDSDTAAQPPEPTKRPSQGVPSNAVYARVGDTILIAAQDGVRRNLPPKDIVREIREEHGVHLSVGELRLLLASRRIPA